MGVDTILLTLFKRYLAIPVVLLSSLLLLSASYSAVAAESSVLADDVAEWVFDFDGGRQQQTFNNSTADLTHVIFTGVWSLENWDASLDAPWYEKQGNFFINGVRPRLIIRCERLEALTPLRQKVLLALGKITQRQLNVCTILLNKIAQASMQNSGMGDVSGVIKYNYPLDDEARWSTHIGLGYKADNGDAETGIGSGTKDTSLESGIVFAGEKNSFSAVFGYNWVSDSSAIAGVYKSKNYAYVDIDCSHTFTDWFSAGAIYVNQQAYVDAGSATKITTGYIDFTATENLMLHIYLTHYSGSDTPDKEAGLSIHYNF